MRVGHYSDYLVRLANLIGIASSGLLDEEKAQFNGWYNKNAKRIWELYPWPNVCVIEDRTPNASLVIGYEQASETEIGEVFEVYNGNPLSRDGATRIGWTLTADGIQLIGPTSASAVYLYYRKRVPDYSGNDFDSTLSYTVGQQVYYTSTANSKGNFYKCLVNTTPGQDPDDTAASWSRIELPFEFQEYVIHASYADWLRSDGQNDKAAQADAQAREILADETDKLERQQRFVPQMIVQTHLTSRPLN